MLRGGQCSAPIGDDSTSFLSRRKASGGLIEDLCTTTSFDSRARTAPEEERITGKTHHFDDKHGDYHQLLGGDLIHVDVGVASAKARFDGIVDVVSSAIPPRGFGPTNVERILFRGLHSTNVDTGIPIGKSACHATTERATSAPVLDLSQDAFPLLLHPSHEGTLS